MTVVIDIGNSRIKGGYFEKDEIKESFSAPHQEAGQKLLALLQNKSPTQTLIASVHTATEAVVLEEMKKRNLPFLLLNPSTLALKLDVEEPLAVGQDRIANCYGALARFPLNDCIVVDVGTAITFDYVAKEGIYTGGAILSGPTLCAKALHDYTDKLPLVAISKPSSPLGKTTATHIQSGIYFGLLGAIERISFELAQLSSSPSSVKLLATGGVTQDSDFAEDLKELVDFIDPHLTLVGLHHILKELIAKEK